MEQLAGLVQSVTTSSASATYSGSLVLQAVGGQVVTVAINNATRFDSEDDNASSPSQLRAGTFPRG
jgi:hypothetical protein